METERHNNIKSNSDLNDSKNEENSETKFPTINKDEQVTVVPTQSISLKNNTERTKNLLKENTDLIKSYSNLSDLHNTKYQTVCV